MLKFNFWFTGMPDGVCESWTICRWLSEQGVRTGSRRSELLSDMRGKLTDLCSCVMLMSTSFVDQTSQGFFSSQPLIRCTRSVSFAEDWGYHVSGWMVVWFKSEDLYNTICSTSWFSVMIPNQPGIKPRLAEMHDFWSGCSSPVHQWGKMHD